MNLPDPRPIQDAHLLKGQPCDKCGKPAARWFKGTGVRVCEQQGCWDHFAAHYQPRRGDQRSAA